MTDDLPTMPAIRDLLRYAAEARGGAHAHFARAWQAMADAGIQMLPAGVLLRAYRRTDGEPVNPEADALLAEIERRGLDI